MNAERSIHYFSGKLDGGHDRFANEFIPVLIEALEDSPSNASKIWDSMFARLKTEYQLCFLNQ